MCNEIVRGYWLPRLRGASQFNFNSCSMRDLDSQRALNCLHAIALDHVAGAHILVVLEGHAALLSGGDFLRIVLEPLELRQLAFVNDDIVADQADIRAALDVAFGDAAAGDLADL